MKTGGRKKKRRRPDGNIEPYRLAQAKQRKAANVARQAVLQEERKEALGDPVRARPAPFADTITVQPPSSIIQDNLNFYVKPADLNDSLAYSKWLTEPLPPQSGAFLDPAREAERKAKHEADHRNAEAALAAISSLENGSSSDRTRLNIQRCIEEFGRHNTDEVLPRKPASIQLPFPLSDPASTEGNSTEDSASMTTPERVGRDTGSPEVQVAILTTKINVLLENVHNKDKHNLRNLRILVHRRQKLLTYLRRKERGGPRWQNLVDKLGINDAMWKGEITLKGKEVYAAESP